MRDGMGWVAGVAVCLLCACGDGSTRRPPDAGDYDAGFRVCRTDDDCSDGVFCNGAERCELKPDDQGGNGCVDGTPPRCDDGLRCTTDVCSHAANGCRFIPVDTDGDGHPASSCVTEEDEQLGDDCDDDDANRFPGNPETCTSDTEDHDEDCDPLTIGHRDVDGDGVVDAACCNDDTCGADCDDQDRRVAPDYPEVCDAIDNNCDNTIDSDAISVAWYVDADGDGFGRPDDNPTESCAPIAGRSLFDTDLDDTNAAINPAAIETCDGVDNDCDSAIDERDVCSCGVPGAEPCECVSGATDCLGDLIPRACVSGFWVAQRTCSGVTPFCLAGRCVCADGTTSCVDVIDRSPPFVLAYSPDAEATHVSNGAVVAVVLSEPPLPSSVNADTFRVFDDSNRPIPGRRTINGQLISFTSDALLPPGHLLHVVFEDVADRAGNIMRSTTAWRFATEIGARTLETINTGETIGFNQPVLRTSPAGDVALWANTTWYCSDCVTFGEDMYRRTSDGAWSGTDWPQLNMFNEVPPLSFAIGAGGLIAAHIQYAGAPLVRRGLDDMAWDQRTLTNRAQPAAVAVAGDHVVSVSQTHNDPLTFLEVVSAQGTGEPSVVPGLPAFAGASEVAVAAIDANTFAVFVLEPSAVTAAYYANGVWSVASAAAQVPTNPSVQVRANGDAVATWLELEEIHFPGGPSLLAPMQRLAFFNASSTALTPVVLATVTAHSTPQVAWLDDMSVLASHAESAPVARHVSIDGTVGPVQRPSGTLDGQVAGEVDVAVLPNGRAVAVWSHDNSVFGPRVLLAARYVDGAWLAAEAIADTGSPTAPQVEPLSDTTALIVWRHSIGTDANGLATVLSP